jgi:hypothetical protein
VDSLKCYCERNEAIFPEAKGLLRKNEAASHWLGQTTMTPFEKKSDISQCLARFRTEKVANCLSAEDVYLFCSYILYFGHERFCAHPQKEEIILATQKRMASGSSTDADQSS